MLEEMNNLFENPQNPSRQNVPMSYPGNPVASAQVQVPTVQGGGYAFPSVPVQTISAGTVNQQPQFVIKADDLYSYFMQQAELMYTCWEKGVAAQRALDARGAASAVSESVVSHAETQNVETCVGVYDRFDYGVFHDEAAIMECMTRFSRFWDKRTLRYQTFATYREALDFAKEGIARLTGRRADALPNPRYQYDWKENVR